MRLTPTEFRLLRAVMLSPGHLVERAKLRGDVLGLDFDPGTDSLRVHVHHLRTNSQNHRGTRRSTRYGAWAINSLRLNDDCRDR